MRGWVQSPVTSCTARRTPRAGSGDDETGLASRRTAGKLEAIASNAAAAAAAAALRPWIPCQVTDSSSSPCTWAPSMELGLLANSALLLPLPHASLPDYGKNLRYLGFCTLLAPSPRYLAATAIGLVDWYQSHLWALSLPLGRGRRRECWRELQQRERVSIVRHRSRDVQYHTDTSNLGPGAVGMLRNPPVSQDGRRGCSAVRVVCTCTPHCRCDSRLAAAARYLRALLAAQSHSGIPGAWMRARPAAGLSVQLTPRPPLTPPVRAPLQGAHPPHPCQRYRPNGQMPRPSQIFQVGPAKPVSRSALVQQGRYQARCAERRPHALDGTHKRGPSVHPRLTVHNAILLATPIPDPCASWYARSEANRPFGRERPRSTSVRSCTLTTAGRLDQPLYTYGVRVSTCVVLGGRGRGMEGLKGTRGPRRGLHACRWQFQAPSGSNMTAIPPDPNSWRRRASVVVSSSLGHGRVRHSSTTGRQVPVPALGKRSALDQKPTWDSQGRGRVVELCACHAFHHHPRIGRGPVGSAQPSYHRLPRHTCYHAMDEGRRPEQGIAPAPSRAVAAAATLEENAGARRRRAASQKPASARAGHGYDAVGGDKSNWFGHSAARLRLGSAGAVASTALRLGVGDGQISMGQIRQVVNSRRGGCLIAGDLGPRCRSAVLPTVRPGASSVQP